MPDSSHKFLRQLDLIETLVALEKMLLKGSRLFGVQLAPYVAFDQVLIRHLVVF
jgi:hypothetical protein